MDSAEPMHLGSPLATNITTSPSNPSGHGHQFLPGFLMGNLSQVSSPAPLNQSLTGSKHQPSTSPLFGQKTMRRSTSQRPDEHYRLLSTGSDAHIKEKGGAPPLATLMDDIAMLEKHASQRERFGSDMKLFSPTRNVSPSRLNEQSRHSVLMTSPSHEGMSSESFVSPQAITSTWVTVFGFPPQQTSLILKQFSQFGTILSYHVAGNGGNWIHIHYETLLQAKKALSRNGKVLCDNMMLGVMACNSIPNGEGQSLLEESSISVTSPHNMSQRTMPIRNLSASVYSSSPQVNNSTPQKTNTMITKAMDFLFG
uniref:Nucleoporin NUP53 n=1 Tax=Phallusia mammillata TaxID=59560 RepID=A0A6F9DMU6_9ASCI|nr:nucleoporin NUP53-like [Phallusia mammillata]